MKYRSLLHIADAFPNLIFTKNFDIIVLDSPMSQGKKFFPLSFSCKMRSHHKNCLARKLESSMFRSFSRTLLFVPGQSFSDISTLFMLSYAQESPVLNFTLKPSPKIALQNTMTHYFNFDQFLNVLVILRRLTLKIFQTLYTAFKFCY